jgi:hypothetical protein
MEIQSKITMKEISFIDDIDFRNLLLDRLTEIDRVFMVNANYSTIFLSISTIEGIFKHLASIFKTEIKQLPIPIYPIYPNGNRKRFDKISIDEFYLLFKEMGILPEVVELEKIYKLFKDYRNFIHPQAQKKKTWSVDLGQAQMALGLLNATLGYLSQNIFIGKEIFQKVAGNPDYDGNKVLHLNLDRTRVHSFIVTKRIIQDTLSLSFDLELPAKSIFNFVFNFRDDGSFKMLRIDNRREPETPNYLLHCTQKYFWTPIYRSQSEYPPNKTIFPVQIEISIPNQLFKIMVDEKEYLYENDGGEVIDLLNEFSSDFPVGFFNEVGPVKLHNVKLI